MSRGWQWVRHELSKTMWMKGSKKRTTSFLPFCIFKIQGSGRCCCCAILVRPGRCLYARICMPMSVCFSHFVFVCLRVYVRALPPLSLKSDLQLTDCHSSLLSRLPYRIATSLITSFTPSPVILWPAPFSLPPHHLLVICSTKDKLARTRREGLPCLSHSSLGRKGSKRGKTTEWRGDSKDNRMHWRLKRMQPILDHIVTYLSQRGVVGDCAFAWDGKMWKEKEGWSVVCLFVDL